MSLRSTSTVCIPTPNMVRHGTCRHNYAVERGLAVGFCGQPLYCNRPYYPTARFWLPSIKPFPDRPRPMSCKSGQTGFCSIIFLWLWPATDHKPHSRHVPTNKIWRRTETTPRSKWRWHYLRKTWSRCHDQNDHGPRCADLNLQHRSDPADTSFHGTDPSHWHRTLPHRTHPVSHIHCRQSVSQIVANFNYKLVVHSFGRQCTSVMIQSSKINCGKLLLGTCLSRSQKPVKPKGEIPVWHHTYSMVTVPAREHHCFLSGIKLYCLIQEAHMLWQLAHLQGKMEQLKVKYMTFWSQI